MVKQRISRSLALAGVVTVAAAACQPGEIYFGNGDTINADGTGEFVIEDYPDYIDYLSFSPDGENTLYRYALDNDVRIVVDSPDFTAPTTLFTQEGDDLVGAPDWSPDGEWIAFHIYRDGEGYFVGLMRPDGSDLTWLPTEGSPDSSGVSWLPDSSGLAYVSMWVGDDDHSLCTTTVATEAVDCSPLPGAFERQYSGASVSPDGGTVLIRAMTGTMDDPIFDVVRVDMDGTDMVNLTGNEGTDWSSNYAWAPDGSAIAFSRELDFGRYGEGSLWTMAPDGSDQVLLTDESETDGFRNIAWRPTPAE